MWFLALGLVGLVLKYLEIGPVARLGSRSSARMACAMAAGSPGGTSVRVQRVECELRRGSGQVLIDGAASDRSQRRSLERGESVPSRLCFRSIRSCLRRFSRSMTRRLV